MARDQLPFAGLESGSGEVRQQLARHALKYRCPMSVFTLSEQFDGCIPGAVFSVQQPTPVGQVGQQHSGKTEYCPRAFSAYAVNCRRNAAGSACFLNDAFERIAQ